MPHDLSDDVVPFVFSELSVVVFAFWRSFHYHGFCSPLYSLDHVSLRPRHSFDQYFRDNDDRSTNDTISRSNSWRIQSDPIYASFRRISIDSISQFLNPIRLPSYLDHMCRGGSRLVRPCLGCIRRHWSEAAFGRFIEPIIQGYFEANIIISRPIPHRPLPYIWRTRFIVLWSRVWAWSVPGTLGFANRTKNDSHGPWLANWGILRFRRTQDYVSPEPFCILTGCCSIR